MYENGLLYRSDDLTDNFLEKFSFPLVLLQYCVCVCEVKQYFYKREWWIFHCGTISGFRRTMASQGLSGQESGIFELLELHSETPKTAQKQLLVCNVYAVKTQQKNGYNKVEST